jgi:DNA-binding XRE family transcriptional regulator
MDNFDSLNTENINVRLLLWQKCRDSSSWASLLLKFASIDFERAEAVLHGTPIGQEERASIIEGFGVDPEPFVSSRLLGMSEAEILLANIQALMQALPSKGKKMMAATIGVAPETISHWSNGSKQPATKNQEKILEYFLLPKSVDLQKTPLFLSITPFGRFSQKERLTQMLEKLSPEELNNLFPALEKLLR